MSNCLTSEIQISNVKMIQMLNVKLFDVQNSNNEGQNDLKSNSLTFGKAKLKEKVQGKSK